ncbi:hypothetical protein AKJ38_02260 [candidate division MSBL1 archaeon SCGC-AAA259I14]|uniref:Uncharacterized protein n=1 Tax=candidate division MSBL1 archaeon SCGC-AAA259I14 TaxID=1698268 RepID=A0A133URW8_9EURY|nr:hypothetical protein AKJ38_02260 [candidate division MSBL1 archaeon SCGC-AAA259I14]
MTVGILDRLIEKKDILSYIDRRIEQLKRDQKRTVENAEPRDKELIRQRFRGRIKELRKTKEIANNKEFRKKSKKIQENLFEGEDPLEAHRGL